MKKIILIFSLFLTFAFAKNEELTVSILPQKYFLQKIVKDKFDINVMVKPGFSPATYEPKTSQMRSLVNSKVYFYIDVPFEDIWLDKFKQSSKNTLFVDTSLGIEKIQMAKHEHHDEEDKTEEHKDEHQGHEHESLDPHIW